MKFCEAEYAPSAKWYSIFKIIRMGPLKPKEKEIKLYYGKVTAFFFFFFFQIRNVSKEMFQRSKADILRV